jgi:hypothetical protein
MFKVENISSSLDCHRYIARKIIVSSETPHLFKQEFLPWCYLSKHGLGLVGVVLELRVVEVLLGHAATEELGLGATDVDVLEENLRGGVGCGHGLSLGDFGVDVGAGLLVEGLELLLGGDLPLEQLLLEADKGTLAGVAPLLTVLDGGLDGEGVHAVDLETRDVLTTLVVLGESGRAVGGGTHTVLVV